MKNLLFYNLHRHYEEIALSSFLFNRSTFLKNNFEVHLHCNNPKHSIESISSKASYDTKTNITITTKNSGYYAGVAEAHSDCFEIFKNYDLVIISQVDCYIVDDSKLINKLQETFDVLVSPMFHVNKKCYAGDFFVIKPKENFLRRWRQELVDRPNPVHEHFLYDEIQKTNYDVKTFNRYESTNFIPHHNLDDFGLWHEHDINRVYSYLKNNNYV